jgi:hypothetical protein
MNRNLERIWKEVVMAWFTDYPETRRIVSPEMLRRVALVRTDVSEEFNASIIRVTRIGELGTLAVASNRRTLRSYGYG